MIPLNIFPVLSSSEKPIQKPETKTPPNSSPKKLDHRIVMTRRLFRQALTELLRQKPLQGITVKELCQKAGVNRGTFYSHYTDIFALMEQIEREVSEELSQALEEFTSRNPESSPVSVYASILQFFRNNSDICVVLLSDYGDRSFVEKLFQTGRESCIAVYGNMYPNASREQLDLFYSFISSGCIGLLRYWIDTGMTLSEETLAKGLEHLVGGAQQYLKETEKDRKQGL